MSLEVEDTRNRGDGSSLIWRIAFDGPSSDFASVSSGDSFAMRGAGVSPPLRLFRFSHSRNLPIVKSFKIIKLEEDRKLMTPNALS